MSFTPLFLVSFAAIAYEIALTRWFAVAKWSEYGYWVISIAMVGLALSGVVLALWREAFVRGEGWIRSALPIALILAAAFGYSATIANPFNPLLLQNPVTWVGELSHIASYYAALVPFFFLTGLFIGLTFVLNAQRVGRVYAFDLVGAGTGALAVLSLMFFLHPFNLVPALLIPLALAAFLGERRPRLLLGAAAVIALIGGEYAIAKVPQAQHNEFKAIFAPLHSPGARALADAPTPRGFYELLSDVTERVDTDISDNAGLIGAGGPPRAYGLYRDGNRIASLPTGRNDEFGYTNAALDAAPYALLKAPRVLLVGSSGGFRAGQVLKLGAARVDLLEPEPAIFGALARGLGPVPPLARDDRVSLRSDHPINAARTSGPYDIVDIAGDFLDAAEINATAISAEAIAYDLRSLKPGGVVSIPVSIREFPSYALRSLATAREALRLDGIVDPLAHTLVYRSAWGVRILLSNAPWPAERVAAVRAFCNDRSFDVSYFPGIDAVAARAALYNDLPAVSFENGEITAQGPDDSIADEAGAVLSGRPSPSQNSFNLQPLTLDKPFYYSILRLDRLDTILRRLEVLPQGEIGLLVNLVVLAQAALIALFVLLVPLVAPHRLNVPGGTIARTVIYFSALGLGFLFIEIFLIEKASFFLNDRTTAFAIVLTGMLVFSGVGALTADQFVRCPRLGITLAVVAIVAALAAATVFMQPQLIASLNLPIELRGALVLAVIAPLSIPLGLPFPLGLARVGSGGLLPWVWGFNGALSVVATPLANLIVREAGLQSLLISALILYPTAWLAFPAATEETT